MGKHKGLDLIKGKVISIKEKTNNKKLKVPHISWNKIFTNQSMADNKEKFDYLDLKYYFVHSYLALTEKTIALSLLQLSRCSNTRSNKI